MIEPPFVLPLLEPVLLTNLSSVPFMAKMEIVRYEGQVLPIVAGKDFEEAISIINRSIKYN